MAFLKEPNTTRITTALPPGPGKGFILIIILIKSPATAVTTAVTRPVATRRRGSEDARVHHGVHGGAIATETADASPAAGPPVVPRVQGRPPRRRRPQGRAAHGGGGPAGGPGAGPERGAAEGARRAREGRRRDPGYARHGGAAELRADIARWWRVRVRGQTRRK